MGIETQTSSRSIASCLCWWLYSAADDELLHMNTRQEVLTPLRRVVMSTLVALSHTVWTVECGYWIPIVDTQLHKYTQ